MPVSYGIKVLIGFYFLYIYTSVYGKGALSADAGAFMDESHILYEVFFTSPSAYFSLLTGIGNEDSEVIMQFRDVTSHWDSGAQAIISDNRNILRIHSIIHFISFGNSAIHVLILNVISLIGIKQLYIALKDRTNLNGLLLFCLLLLFPSLLFWTSGILKEPIMILGLGLFLRGLLGINSKRKKWFYTVSGAIVLFAFKPYILIAMFPALIFYGLYRIIPKYKILTSLIILMLIGVLGSSFFSQKRDAAVHMLTRKQFDFKNVGKGGLHAMADTCFYFFKPHQLSLLKIEEDSVSILTEMDVLILQHGAMEGPKPARLKPTDEKLFIYFINERSDGYIELTMIDDSFKQLLLNIPEALVNCLFRPFFNDPGSWLKYPAMLETVLLYLFLIFAFFKRKKLSQETQALIVALILFVICLSLIIGWVTPVLGAIVRYRFPVYLAILVIALLLINQKKLLKSE
jgi:hypothetical protein